MSTLTQVELSEVVEMVRKRLPDLADQLEREFTAEGVEARKTAAEHEAAYQVIARARDAAEIEKRQHPRRGRREPSPGPGGLNALDIPPGREVSREVTEKP